MFEPNDKERDRLLAPAGAGGAAAAAPAPGAAPDASPDDREHEENPEHEQRHIHVQDEIDRIGVRRSHWRIALILGLGNCSDAVELGASTFLVNAYRDGDGRELSDSESEFLTASVFVGMLLGGMVCGVMSDRVGRKPCLLASLGINVVAALLSAVAWSTPWLIAFRTVAGVGVGGSVPSVFSMAAELFPSADRGRFLTLVAAFWMVGSLFTAGTAWVMLGEYVGGGRIWDVSWRWFAATVALPAFGAFWLTLRFVPESPRFLVVKGRDAAAARALAVLADDEPGYAVRGEDLVHATAAEQADVPIAALFEGDLLRPTALLLMIWWTLSFGFYGMSSWITRLFEHVHMDNVYFDTFLYCAGNIPGNLFSIKFVDVMGRKRMLAWSMCLASVSAICFAFGKSAGAWLVVSSAVLFNALSIAGWNALDCLSAECFPTAVRTTAMGVLAAGGRLGSIAAQFVNGSLIDHVALLLIVTGSTMFVGGISAMLLPKEPKGEQLADHVGSTIARSEAAERIRSLSLNA